MAEIKIDAITPNSHKYNQQTSGKTREKIDPVIRKDAIVSTKKPLGKRLWDLFIGESPQEFKKHMIEDVLIPGAKDALFNMVSMALYQEPFRGHSKSSGYHVNYGRFFGGGYKSASSRSSEKKENSYQGSSRVDHRNIILNNRASAEQIVDYMRDRIQATGSISVAEFLDAMELPSRFTDNDWGWTKEDDIGIKRVGSGFLIDVRDAEPLD